MDSESERQRNSVRLSSGASEKSQRNRSDGHAESKAVGKSQSFACALRINANSVRINPPNKASEATCSVARASKQTFGIRQQKRIETRNRTEGRSCGAKKNGRAPEFKPSDQSALGIVRINAVRSSSITAGFSEDCRTRLRRRRAQSHAPQSGRSA
jgi:hypothetical protein